MTTTELKDVIARNAAELVRLHRRIHEAVSHRDESDEQRRIWSNACDEFQARYSALAFPGGCDRLYERISEGDPGTIEAALCFLEVRPYFFRSGYMYKDILRKCRKAPMSREQSDRFAAILERYTEWKRQRALSVNRGAAVRATLLPLLLRLHSVFPTMIADGKFDGLGTVGDFYSMLCNALKVEPHPTPEESEGAGRSPLRISLPAHAEYWEAYRHWRNFRWTPEDIWATLTAAIRDAYALDTSFVVVSTTSLSELITR